MAVQDFNQVIGRAITDEGFRGRLLADPARALAGYDLTPEEHHTLSNLDGPHLEHVMRLHSSNQVSEVHVRGYDPDAKKQIVGAAQPQSKLGGAGGKRRPGLLAGVLAGLLIPAILLGSYLILGGTLFPGRPGLAGDPCSPDNRTATAAARLTPSPTPDLIGLFKSVGGLSSASDPCDFEEGGYKPTTAAAATIPPSATTTPTVAGGSTSDTATTPPACVPIPDDGLCSACENTDLDSASCVCKIDGKCEPGEGLNCPDCAPTDTGGGSKGGGGACKCKCGPNGCFDSCTQKQC